MNSRVIIEQQLARYSENELIFASRFYREHCADSMSEAAYYKSLQRMCEAEALTKIAKGVYCKPLKTRFGTVLPSEKEIIKAFTQNSTGMVVGYTLYNSMQLTTQVSKNIHVYSSCLEEQKKQVGSVSLQNYQMNFEEDVVRTIQMLEVLQNYYKIQDLNQVQFLKMCEQYALNYNNEACEYVFEKIKYLKRTIAFLQKILEYHNVPNNLNRYLSELSEYRIPSMEALYETARV